MKISKGIAGCMLGSMLGIGALTAPVIAQAGINLDIDIAPPAPRVEEVPPPRRGYVWGPGFYRWDGHGHHVWVAGRWHHERPGYHWVPDGWEQRGPHYHYNPGHWERG